MSPTFNKTHIVLAITLVISGCATGPNGKPLGLEESLKATFASDDPCSKNARNTGIAVGAVIVGFATKASGGDSKNSVILGAGVGAAIGGLIGSDMDRRRCEISKVAKVHNLDIVMTDINLSNPDTLAAPNSNTAASTTAGNKTNATKKSELVGMSLSIIDHGQQFATGSTKPSEASVKAFGDVANQYVVQADNKQEKSLQAAQDRNKKIRILLIGHTDDTGSSYLNADLSEKRAQAIAEIFAKHGFGRDQIFYQGAGEVFPTASNSTEEGRARNRRVEIVDLSDDRTFAAFLESRRPNIAHYRPTTTDSAKTELASDTPAAENKKPTPVKLDNMTQATPSKPANKEGSIAKAPKPQPTAADNGSNATALTPSAAATSSNKTGIQAASSVTAKTPQTAQAIANLDLGGKPANGHFRSVDIGKTEQASSFNIISSAYVADESPLGSCATDRPRISRGVKSLGSGIVFKTSAYLPGTAASSWGGKVNGHMVGMSNVSVLRDGSQPASRPVFFIWKNYEDGTKAPPDLKTSPEVNTYLGDKALLYRVFLTEGPVRCLDMVIPKGVASAAPNSNIVYQHNNALYQADFSPSITR